MKKTIRTGKKVLSVFLSVLMVLSAWVFVAPEAGAADGNKYYVKVYVNIYDGSDGYAGAYTVNTETGKPDNYSWATNDGWYGRINMTGFTVFGEGGDYDAQDVSAELVEAEKLGTYYAMSGLSDDNANGDWDSKAIATAEYTFTLDSFPVEIFWMNDENNWDGGNTGFAIRKLTVATSEGGTEHTMWEGLAGSDSETYNYYGSITPTGIHTCFEDYAKNYDMSDYKFYKSITTSSQRAWSDPYSAGTAGTYYLNDYQSGGVSATFSEGVESVAYNVDYINTGSTDTYFVNITNHSKTQNATITSIANSGYFETSPVGKTIAPGATESYKLKNISSLGNDGNYAEFTFTYTLENVYESDALDASLAVFTQPVYIGTWNAQDDSKQISDENGDGNTGFSLYKADNYTWGDNSMTIVNTFQTTEGIIERNSATSGDGTDKATFNYNYYIDTSGKTNWSQTGLRFHVKESQYYTLSFQPADYTSECGTITMGGTFANPNEASITIADIASSSVTEEFKYNHDQASGFYTYADYYTTGTPMWYVTQSDNNASFYNNSEGWFRFAGNIIKGSGNSAATINFSNMTYRERQNGQKVYFSGTINVYAFDKAELRKYIQETLLDFAPMSARYNTTAFSAYETALQNAMLVLANQKTTQDAINQALANLKTAVAALQSNDNLINQIDSLTHIQYVDGIGSEIENQTDERYVLIPLGEHTVPQKAEYVGNGTFRDATNKKSNLITNYTVDDTEIDYLNYYYWNIDYSQVDVTIALVDEALENFDSDTYSSTLKTALENAKEQLEAIDQTTTGDNTPTSQEDVDNVIKAATDLLAHIDEGYEHCDYDANDDGENELKTKASTCSEAGYTYYKCNICGKVQKVEDLELAEHSWDAGTETTAPNCNDAGVMTYTCLTCGATKTEAISATGHNYVVTDLGDGTHISKCSKCGAVETDAVAEAHNYTYTNNADGTHTATCSVCNATATVAHIFTNPVLVRPTLVDGVWEDGTYTYTCICGEIKTEPAVRADYSDLEAAVAELEALKDNENLTDDEKAVINNALADADDLADNLVTSEQGDIDALVKELKDIKADVDEAIKNKELGVNKITEATSGVKVQFIDKSGLGTIENIQLGKDDAFKIRVANGNADSTITITDIQGTGIAATGAKTLEPGKSADFDITVPEDLQSGIITYTITYTIDGLKDADGNAVEFTTKAYLYVKDAAVVPYHFMDEDCANVLFGTAATSEWKYTLGANLGDFEIIHKYKAPFADFGNDNLYQDSTSLTDVVKDQYDYEDEKCYAGCSDADWKKGDAHAGTYRYYIDTSLASTWEDAGLHAKIEETAASYYDNAPFKYVRLANNQRYLSDTDNATTTGRSFTVTIVPSGSTNVPNKTWTASSIGDMTVYQYNNPNQDEWLFGEHKNNDATNINSAYANFSGEIPKASNKSSETTDITDENEAKLMFSWRMEYNKASGGIGAQAEAVTMTTHLYITSYDKGELREAVTNAETAGYNSEYYDADKYEAYENALAVAKEVLGKAETNQNEVDAATEALNNAIADLSAAENEAKFVLTVTHSIHEYADKNSEATGTEYDYYLVNGTVAPALKADVIARDTINKYDDVVTLDVTADAEHTYYYWYIDYSKVQDALDAADEIINNADDYNEDFINDVTEKKEALEDILEGKDDTTAPETQATVDDAIEAVTNLTGHVHNTEEIIPAEPATCTGTGLTEGKKCSECGKITVAQTTTSALGHNFEAVGANAATCLAPGNEAYKHCTVCDLYFAADAGTDSTAGKADATDFVIAQLDHSYTGEYKWNNAGEIKYHSQMCVNGCNQYGEEVPCTIETTTVAPTCTVGGTNTHTCIVCNNSYETYTAANGHTWGEPVLTTAPTADKQGEYTETCGVCGATQITKVNLADYKAFNEAVKALEDLAKTEGLTDEAKTAIEKALEKAEELDKNLPADVTTVDGKDIEGGQDEIDALVTELNGVVAGVTDSINDGSALKPDYTAWDAAETAYDALDKTNVKAEIIAEAEALKAEIADKQDDDTLTQKTATQKDIDDATARLNEIITGIKDGSLKDPDYSAVEEKLTQADNTAGLNKDTQDKIDEIKEALEEIKGRTEPEANYRDDQDEVDALENRLDEILGSIADGSALEPDYTAWDAAEGTYDAFTEETLVNVKTEILDEVTGLKNTVADIRADDAANVADHQQTIDDSAARLNEIITGINDGSMINVDTSEAYDAIGNAETHGVLLSEEETKKLEDLRTQLQEIENNPDSNYKDDQETVDLIRDQANAIYNKYTDCAEGNHDWTEWTLTLNPTETVAGKYERTCNICGTTTFRYVAREDYTAYDTAVERAEGMLENTTLTDAAKAEIQAALAEAQTLDQNLPKDLFDHDGTTKLLDNNNDVVIKEATDKLNAVLDSIANDTTGTYEKVNYNAYNAAVNAYETLKGTMTAEDKAAVEAIKAEIAEIPADGSKKDYQTQVDKAAADIAAINAKYGDCAEGNHTWGEPVLTTAPTADNQGEYTETCGVCGATQITKVDLADYDAFNEAVKALEDLAKTEGLTDEAKTAIENALDKAEELDKNLPDDATTVDGKEIEGGQDEIDALVTELNGVVADVTDDIADGSALKPVYEAWEEAETAYDALDKTNVKDEIIAEADALKAAIAGKQADDTLTQATATQKEINEATARLNEIIAGINDGSLKDPDYSAVEEKLTQADNTADLNKDTQDKIDEIKEALEEIQNRTEPEANAKDDQDEVDALEDQLDEILDSIADGTATAPDYTEWDAAEGTYAAIDKTNVPEDLVTEATDLKATIDALKADDTANAVEDQPTINDATARLNEIIDEINDILTEKPNFTGYDASHEAYEKLVEQYGDKIKDDVANDVAALDTIVEGVRDDETATKIEDQTTIDDAKTALDAIITGINDGSLRDPDYSAVEEKLTQADNTADLNKDTQDKIDEIKEALEEIQNRTEPEANYRDDQDEVDALEDQLDEILDSITDGTAKAPDYTEWDAAEGTYDALDKTNVKAEIIAEADTLKAEIDALKADDTANAVDDQPTINDATARLNEIIEGIEDGSLLKEKLNYDEYNAQVERYDEYSKDGKLTDDEKNTVLNVIRDTELKVEAGNITQAEIDAAAEAISDVLDRADDCENDNHNAVIKGKTTAPTCTEDGYTIYSCVCGYTEKKDIVTAEGHAYTSVVTEPTCTEDGYTTHTCTVCGDSYTDDIVPATGHSYSKSGVTAPSCTEDGYTTYTCKCGDFYKGDFVDATGHSYTAKVIEPTCEDQGYTTYTCTCGDSYTDDIVPAKGHSYIKSSVTAPSCTEKGYTTYTCSCGDFYKADFTDAKGHTEVTLPAKEATCTATGLTAGVKCSECDTVLVAQEIIPAIRHIDEDGDGKCDHCGTTDIHGGCGCICHRTGWFWRLIYIIVRLIWRVFKIHQFCVCGAAHF